MISKSHHSPHYPLTVSIFFLVIWRAIKECYNPKKLWMKFWPLVLIRVTKTTAICINEKVGFLFFGWNGRENKLYDYAGLHTHILYQKLYGKSLTEDSVREQLIRRFGYCAMTVTASFLQTILLLNDLGRAALIITWMLAPITFVDRQWTTSVNKLGPRTIRAIVITINSAYRDLFSKHNLDVTLPKDYRLYNYSRFINIVNVEILSGFLQFTSGMFLIVYSCMLAFTPGEALLLPYWSIILIRVIKETTNFISPLIEWTLTSTKYEKNEEWCRTPLSSIVDQIDPIDLQDKILNGDKKDRDLLVDLLRKYILESEEKQNGLTSQNTPVINYSSECSENNDSCKYIDTYLWYHMKFRSYTPKELQLLEMFLRLCQHDNNQILPSLEEIVVTAN